MRNFRVRPLSRRPRTTQRPRSPARWTPRSGWSPDASDRRTRRPTSLWPATSASTSYARCSRGT